MDHEHLAIRILPSLYLSSLPLPTTAHEKYLQFTRLIMLAMVAPILEISAVNK